MTQQGKKRVLVIDDSPTVRSHAMSVLGSEFDSETAANGLEGWRKILELTPDAVILDLEMPGMDGVELLRLLRTNERTKGIPVLISTTVTEVDKVNECRRLGCVGFVLKPLREEYILAKLRYVTTAALCS